MRHISYIKKKIHLPPVVKALASNILHQSEYSKTSIIRTPLFRNSRSNLRDSTVVFAFACMIHVVFIPLFMSFFGQKKIVQEYQQSGK